MANCANVIFDVLYTCTFTTDKAGLLLEDLLVMVQYEIAKRELEMKISASQVLELTIMYLRAKEVNFQLSRVRGRTTIRGISFRKGNVQSLVDLLSTGVMTSVENVRYADELYEKIKTEV